MNIFLLSFINRHIQTKCILQLSIVDQNLFLIKINYPKNKKNKSIDNNQICTQAVSIIWFQKPVSFYGLTKYCFLGFRCMKLNCTQGEFVEIF